MCPAPLDDLKPGQLFYNTREEQHAVVLGNNGIGWLLQYEDGDIVELGGPGYNNYLSDDMVYKPAPREIEIHRPNLACACQPTEHVFFAEPTTPHERSEKPIRCAVCGLEHEVLIDDLGQSHETIRRQLRGKCQHCGDEIPPGELEKMSMADFYTCFKCSDNIETMSRSEYKSEFGTPSY